MRSYLVICLVVDLGAIFIFLRTVHGYPLRAGFVYLLGIVSFRNGAALVIKF